MPKIYRFILFTWVIKLTLAINQYEIFWSRQGLSQYGQLQPDPDPPLTPPFRGQNPQFSQVADSAFQPPRTPVVQPPGVQAVAQTAAEQAAQQAAAQQAQQAAAQQAAAQQAQQAAAQQAADAQNQQATFQCDQTLMGRDFEYNSALNLIQNEDYLADSDIDALRVFKRQGKEVSHILEWNEENLDYINPFDDDYQPIRKRRETQDLPQTKEEVKEKTADKFVDKFHDILEEKLNRDKRDTLSDDDLELLSDFENDHHPNDRVKRQSPSSYIPQMTVSSPDDCSFLECFNSTDLPPPGLIGTAVLAGAGLTLALNPAPGNVPSNAPQPGSPGGGALPSANPGNILALVPAGLSAVAVFPPFATARTVTANAVIFKEAATSFSRRRSYRRSIDLSFKDKFMKNVRCLIPRLKAKFGRKPNTVSDGYGKKKRDTGYGYHYYEPDYRYQQSRYGYHHHRAGYGAPEECGTIEDCFDRPCPKFGYAVKITYTRRGPPPRDSNNSGYGGYHRRGFQSRQTGEGFTSAAPPDCRVVNYY